MSFVLRFRKKAVTLLTIGCISIPLLAPVNAYSVAKEASNISSNPEQIKTEYNQQRRWYDDARKALSKKDIKRYKRLKKRLSDYPLYPYLEYNEIKQELVKLPYAKIDKFFKKHANTYLGDQLLNRWLNHLASIDYWKTYQRYYISHQDTIRSTKLKCFYIQSTINTGKAFPSELAKSLWLNGRSQPDACNPAFDTLKQKGLMTQELLFARHQLAIDKRNYSLGQYLQKSMKGKTKKLAELHAQIRKNPSNIKIISQFNQHHQDAADIVYDGLYRYSHKDASHALQLLSQYQKTQSLDEKRFTQLRNRIATKLIQQDKLLLAEHLIGSLPPDGSEDSTERLLRELLKTQQWSKILHWIAHLPEKAKQSDRWQYWKARSLEASATAPTAQGKKEYLSIYTSLAKNRSFYGFLSADKLQQPYFFEDMPAVVDSTLYKQAQQSPSFQRAKELYLSNRLHLARLEWRYGIKGLNAEELIAAGQLANQWGWHRKSIEVMASAKYWDDLAIRFPVAHESSIEKYAKIRKIPSSLIFAIARQESAWEFDAQSRVGARGLMQIMPATAKETAKKAGIRYSKRKLFEPYYNISLGSHYISQLLERFDNNRPLAIAAYNAGPSRVNRWLSNSQAQLPTDVWIEIIPFNETRKYVQNVLSYEVIYNYRRGQEQQLLTLAETGTRL